MLTHRLEIFKSMVLRHSYCFIYRTQNICLVLNGSFTLKQSTKFCFTVSLTTETSGIGEVRSSLKGLSHLSKFGKTNGFSTEWNEGSSQKLLN